MGTINSGATPALPRAIQLTDGTPPIIGDTIARAWASEDALIADALQQLGQPGTQSMDGRLEQSQLSAEQNRYVARVELGTPVQLGPGDDQRWRVVGAGQSDRVDLARVDADGVLHRTQRRWPALLERNPNLLAARPYRDATGQPWSIRSTGDAASQGREGTVTLVRRLNDTMGFSVEARWGDVLAETGAERLHPTVNRPIAPGHTEALRQLVGDTKLVTSGAPKLASMPPVLVATESMPQGAAEVLDDVQHLGDWVKSASDLDSWQGSNLLRITTDAPEFIGNAGAAHRNGGAMVFEGPRSRELRDAMLANQSAYKRTMLARTDNTIADHRTAVMGHEATHDALQQLWENFPASGRPRMTAARIEEGVVNEAMADLLGAARAESESIGVRRLGTLEKGAHDLDELRRGIAHRGDRSSVHLGTQLLTKPMTYLARSHGWPMVAEVTGAAAHQVGIDYARGTVEDVSLPHMATELRNATARRLGADAPVVQAMESTWKLLGVLR